MNLNTADTDELLRDYETGRITARGLILSLLSLTGKRRLLKILGALPEDLLPQLKDFTDNYKPDRRVFRGPPPRPETVRLVKEWLAGATRAA